MIRPSGAGLSSLSVPRASLSAEAQKNRAILLGLMTAAGWDFYRNEWWHYQLFDARKLYPLISDKSLKHGLM